MKALKRKQKSTRPIKVLQFGGGNFLRGYFDWMVDVLNKQTDFNGDVVIVKPTEKGDYKPLRDQDGLYHVRTNGIKDGELVSDVDLVECVQEIIHPYNEWHEYLKSAHTTSIRFIVSNTTESGIRYNEEDSFTNQPPTEFPAKLCHWLHERWMHFEGSEDKGCVIYLFELIEDNGDKLKECILQYAGLWGLDKDFKLWIGTNNFFCNTLVDRIVTGFPKSNIDEVYNAIGYEDKLIVDAEPYHLLAIQGPELVKAELPFDKTKLNVAFVDNLKPHREIKVRILNGAHTSMVPMGLINNVETVGQFMKDVRLRKWLEDLVIKEIIPTLDYPIEQLKRYYDDVMDRFQNPFIEHKLQDISLNSISKFKTRVLPSLIEYNNRHSILPSNILQAFAALIFYYMHDSNNEPATLRDSQEVISFFHQMSKKDYGDQPGFEVILSEVLANKDFWGLDLSKIDRLNTAIADSYKHIDITSQSKN